MFIQLVVFDGLCMCVQGWSLWWTAMTGRELARLARSWWGCWRKMSCETLYCSCSLINRYIPDCNALRSQCIGSHRRWFVRLSQKHCSVQPWTLATHCDCSVYVDLVLYPLWHCLPSVLWHCWLGHLNRKNSDMTYNVFGGTLNLAQLNLWHCKMSWLACSQGQQPLRNVLQSALHWCQY